MNDARALGERVGVACGRRDCRVRLLLELFSVIIVEVGPGFSLTLGFD
jgi:hypothetical protein